jgi:CheY-like chemotaxis protein
VPVERAVAPPVTLVRSLERSSPIIRAAKAPIRLLIADDDKNMRTLAEIMLSRRGYEMTLVEDGAAAVESALAATYDCIIVDMHMPVMHGPDVMRAIQKAEMENSRRRPPMIALTADVIPDHIRKFVNAGADAVVAKPVDWNQLDAKIQELTAIRLAARAS